jgi:transcriptional regulator with XRE-family HTH domain
VTFTIAPGSPKAVKAAAFGRELVKACRARDIPLKELERVTGVGHTSLDNYRRGLILPKVEVAQALAAALEAPGLARMIIEARTFVCRRSGCRRTFRNDTGAPRKYCSESCRRIAENVRIAATRARSHGQTRDARSKEHQIRRLRGGLAIADERARLVDDAIAAMCAECEPEGVCRTEACPLRAFSPLPLEGRRLRAAPRTEFRIRSDSWTPARIAKHGATMRAVHAADPTIRERVAAGSRARHAAMTPPQREAWIGKISATKRARSAPRGAAR